MKAIIHIGMPKTGSTAIQTWLHTNRAALEAAGVRFMAGRSGHLLLASIHVAIHQLGIDEKTAWQGVEGKPIMARRLGIELDRKAGRRKVVEQKRVRAEKIEESYRFLTGEIENLPSESRIFVSSDERIYNKRNLIPAIDRIFARYFDERTYVVYIRNTVDHLVSYYSHKLRRHVDERHGTMQFSKYLKKCASRRPLLDTDSSMENLFAWRNVLGKKFNVRLMESDWLVGEDLLEDFSSLIGVGAFCKPGMINESLAAEYVEYVRFLNRRFGSSLPDGTRSKAIAILTRESTGKPKPAPSRTQAESIRAAHRDLEERVRKTFFPERKFLFSRKHRGDGIMPLPLTSGRKAEIESTINEKLSPKAWNPRMIARKGEMDRPE